MYGVVVRFELREGHEDDFDAILEATIRHLKTEEPGTLCYFVSRVDGAPSARVFVELFADKEAFAVHESRPVRRFMEEGGVHFSTNPEVWLIAPEAGVVRAAFSKALE